MHALYYVVASVMFNLLVTGQLTKIDERPISDGMKKMTFKTPTLSEEDTHSNFLPAELKCDACRVVAYQARQILLLLFFSFYF